MQSLRKVAIITLAKGYIEAVESCNIGTLWFLRLRDIVCCLN